LFFATTKVVLNIFANQHSIFQFKECDNLRERKLIDTKKDFGKLVNKIPSTLGISKELYLTMLGEKIDRDADTIRGFAFRGISEKFLLECFSDLVNAIDAVARDYAKMDSTVSKLWDRYRPAVFKQFNQLHEEAVTIKLGITPDLEEFN